MPTRALPILPGYEITSRLGRGAGAVILMGRDGVRGRDVTIKHIVRRTPEDERFIAQAENEYEVGRALSHPYLRQCYDIVRVKKWLKTRELLLIMEYVDGQRLEDHRPQRMEAVLNIFIKVAEGLHAMHQHGFAHADIKPNNILLTPGGALKIIDFGQSCPLGHRKERVQGTPDYIAPEQVLRQTIDQRTDVYNLGATMYWVVTGKWFRTMINVAPVGATRITLESQRGNDPPHALNARVPLPLSRLIMECCETAPQRRPRDMREVVSRLETVQHLLQRSEHRRRRSGGHRE